MTPPPTPQPDAQTTPPPILRSEQLLDGAREVAIHHAGEIYRLRLTSNGRLILTK